jgi:uncharacterized protein YdeI (YjbR/CyaY-like superfamily)
MTRARRPIDVLVNCAGVLVGNGGERRAGSVANARQNEPMTQRPISALQVHADTLAAWRAWLQHHHTQTTGVWLVLWKKASGRMQMDYEQAVQEALRFGWVDSKPNTLDEQRSLLWFAPRKPGTGWSRINKDRVALLIAQGRMAAAGQAKVDQARADGSWSALDEVENLVIPPDLQTALTLLPPAEQHFAAFPRSAKRGILEWIGNAKTEATRSKRLQQTAEMASVNQRANQWHKASPHAPPLPKKHTG